MRVCSLVHLFYNFASFHSFLTLMIGKNNKTKSQTEQWKYTWMQREIRSRVRLAKSNLVSTEIRTDQTIYFKIYTKKRVSKYVQ